jgi:signal transduction histidine kinase
LRELRRGKHAFRVGTIAAWGPLKELLLSEIEDLGPGATLVPSNSDSNPTNILAVLPIELKLAANPMASGGWTPTQSVLTIVGSMVVLSLLGCFLVLHRALDLGARRVRFLAAVTHELRSPLTTFRLYTQLLASGAAGSEDRRMDYIKTLDAESGRLARVLDSVLAFSRLEEGSRVLHKLRELSIEDILLEIGPHLERRAIEGGFLIVYPTGGENLRVRTDLDMVEHVLTNLVDNSCKYAVSATDRRIELHVVEAGNSVDLFVRDHGPGISSRDHERVFQAFERGLPHESGTIPGVGLGLALSRSMARSQGGDLFVAASEEGGLSMSLRLPRASSN